jgi:hypothetical protein
MMNLNRYFLAALALFAMIISGGCAQPPIAEAAADAKPESMEHAEEIKGGIPVPPAVRDNLGITFAAVERRAVSVTRRLPGQFELLPTARQEYRALLGGRIELQTAQFQSVQPGDVLFTIDSPRWREIQHEAVEAEGDITMAEAALDVARAQRQEMQTSLGVQSERLANLAAVNVRKADLEAEAAALRSSLPRLDAEVRAQEAALREAHEHYASRLKALSSVTGLSVDALKSREGEDAAWRGIAVLPVRAQQAGVVETLAANNGGWLEEGALAMTVLDPAAIRFLASAPQSDIGYFRDGQTAAIVPQQGGSVEMQSALSGTVTLGLTADEHTRTLPVYVTPAEPAPWAKAGVGGYLEVALQDGAREQWAIPVSCVIQDGLEHVFFRRDPEDPDRVKRVVADLGESDGRWIAVKSGLKKGDEVVLDGVYALKLTGSAQQAPPGYHYHADGSLHKEH